MSKAIKSPTQHSFRHSSENSGSGNLLTDIDDELRNLQEIEELCRNLRQHQQQQQPLPATG